MTKCKKEKRSGTAVFLFPVCVVVVGSSREQKKKKKKKREENLEWIKVGREMDGLAGREDTK